MLNPKAEALIASSLFIGNPSEHNGNSEINKPITEMKQSGKIQSPALSFLHELDHFVEWTKDEGVTTSANNHLSDKYYNNKEEKRVITGSESQAARRPGEPTRTSHYGIPVMTSGPTSRIKLGYPPQIELQFRVKQAIQEQTKGTNNN